jgi:hypothetical protein
MAFRPSADRCEQLQLCDSLRVVGDIHSGHDSKLCLLTMYLLNGELFRNSQDIKKLPAKMATTNYMQYVSLNKFYPLVVKKRLFYLKACLPHKVSLLQAELLTEGNL